MKNLYKKICVVALSSALLIGGLPSSIPLIEAMSINPKVNHNVPKLVSEIEKINKLGIVLSSYPYDEHNPKSFNEAHDFFEKLFKKDVLFFEFAFWNADDFADYVNKNRHRIVSSYLYPYQILIGDVIYLVWIN